MTWVLMPIFPLFGWLLLITFGKRLKDPWPGVIGSLTIGISFALALVGFLTVRNLHEGEQLRQSFWDFLPVISLKIGFALDSLSSILTMVITGIGFLIHVYSIGYMKKDVGFSRYFAYLNFFVAMMLILVLADSYPLMFIGWEGVGLASFLLIGFWYMDKQNSNAARKAFIINRIGDLFFLLAMFLIYRNFGTLDIHTVGLASKDFAFATPVVELVGIFLLLGAAGKSAQLPLSTWLPDAMAGPTPVSALIHAATMVTAGVYLIARSHFIFNLAPDASNWLAWIGALTALYGAVSAIAQRDIKKILAYSTISQLGYMFLAVGSGAYWVAIFHVVTHAFFKALLFLSAGSVIHATGEQDVNKLGGLRRILPITHFVSLVGVLAIAGIIPLAGFWSKDAILTSVFTNFNAGEGRFLLWGIGIIVAFLTALYMGRWYILVFLGQYRGQSHPHESSSIMNLPLIVLTGLSIVGGFIGLPHFLGKNINLIEHFIEKSAPNAFGISELSLPTEIILIVIALMAGILGLAIAFWWYKRRNVRSMIEMENPVGRVSRQALYLDTAYDYSLARPATYLAESLNNAEEAVLDEKTAGGLVFVSENLREWQAGFVRVYAITIIISTVGLLVYVLWRFIF